MIHVALKQKLPKMSKETREDTQPYPHNNVPSFLPTDIEKFR